MRSSALAAAVLALTLLAAPLAAESESGRRVKAGIRVFRTILAADSDIASKRGSDGTLLLLLVGDAYAVQQLTPLLQQTISENKVSVKAIRAGDLASYATQPVAGVFLVDPVADDALRQIIKFGIDRHVVVYSPFEGDVEKGVLGGLSIEATVRPFINMGTLRASSMRIKPFFLRVAKLHE